MILGFKKCNLDKSNSTPKLALTIRWKTTKNIKEQIKKPKKGGNNSKNLI